MNSRINELTKNDKTPETSRDKFQFSISHGSSKDNGKRLFSLLDMIYIFIHTKATTFFQIILISLK